MKCLCLGSNEMCGCQNRLPDGEKGRLQDEMPKVIYAWHSTPMMGHVGTWATTRYPDDAVEYVPRSAFMKMKEAAQFGLDMARANDLWNTADKIRREMDAVADMEDK